MSSPLSVAFSIAIVPFVAFDDNYDILRELSAKAQLIVVGEIATDPRGIRWQPGVNQYLFDFKVTEVLKGKTTTNVAVRVVRFEQDKEDLLPDLKKGVKCILFLKSDWPNKPEWKSADPWFGFQRYSPAMARSLKSLSDEEASEKGKAQKP